MESNRFDSLTKALAMRMPRRSMLKKTAGVASLALAAGHLRSTVAQDAGTTATDRFISVRRYSTSSSIQEATEGLRGIISVMESSPGFISYDLVDAGNGEILAISTFLDQSSAVAAAQQEDSWIQQNASSILPDSPQIMSGDVFLRSDIDAGCGCITGTQNPCNSDQLVCCATTDRTGGPGVCLTSETTCPGTTPDEPTVTPAAPTATAAATATATATPPCTGEGCDCATGTQNPCDQGLVCCSDDPNNPPGGSGTCRSEDKCNCSEQGCHCNGGVEGTCDNDLVCCQEKPGTPGGGGTCQPSDSCSPPPCTSEGCQCATGTQDPCDQGLVCCTGAGDGTPTAPGASGICRSEDSCNCTTAGCHCNAGVQDACDDGLTCCQGQEGVPGGPGVCQESC
jgi:hypothetical protein